MNQLTPKEEAIQLVEKFMLYSSDEYDEHWSDEILKENRLKNAKECAIICVNRIIESQPLRPVTCPVGSIGENKENSIKYYQQVFQEISKL